MFIWRFGLDVEATAILSAIYNGGEIEEDRMRRVIGLFRIDFTDPSALRPEFARTRVFLCLAMTGDGVLRIKPQNLLTSLRSSKRT